MSEAKPPLPEIKPVAVFVDQGTVITQEFVSRDGYVLAGYRTTPEAAGFPAKMADEGGDTPRRA